jgi:hypothetical protein
MQADARNNRTFAASPIFPHRYTGFDSYLKLVDIEELKERNPVDNYPDYFRKNWRRGCNINKAKQLSSLVAYRS